MNRLGRDSFVLLCCLCVTSQVNAAGPLGADSLLPLGEFCYRIPELNGRGINASPVPLHEEPRRGTNYLLLRFLNAEIAAQVKEYQLETTASGRAVEALVVGVTVMAEGAQEQRRSNESRMHLDLLYAGPGYESRIVERIPGVNLFRLYHSPDKTSWMIATRAPDMERQDTHEGGDLWVAACTNFSWQKSPSGMCKTSVERGGFSMSLSTREENVLLREQIADYVVGKLQSWKSPCS